MADQTGPATGARWGMVCAGTALIGTCYGFARFAYGLFAPEFQDTFAMTSTLSGIISSGSYVGYCVAIVLSLVLTERLGARRVAVSAGVVATIGITIVAVSPTAPVLAAGVLVAGSSTGIASPPMAAAVDRWVRRTSRDRAQTVVNAGTGIGVLVSGPVALLLVDSWRWAWGVFAILAAAVTVWVHHSVPRTTSESSGSARGTAYPPGSTRLLTASFAMGLASIAVWTFGRDLVTDVGGTSTLASTAMWSVLGAAGFVGAFGGDVVSRFGLPHSWSTTMVLMGAATLLLAAAPGSSAAILPAATVFGATYILLTGVILLWSTRVHPERASFGVGLAFLMIAAGQAVGAPVAGLISDAYGITAAFYTCAALAMVGAFVRPRFGATPAHAEVGTRT